MSTRPVSPAFASAVLIGVTVLALALLPISLEIRTNTATADTAAENDDVDVEFTLTTLTGGDPVMSFVGVGGDIDGQSNPTLTVEVGQRVRITLVNGEPVLHDLAIDEFNASTGELLEEGATGSVTFIPTRPGDYFYYCSIPGHRQIGMAGVVRVVGEALEDADVTHETPHGAHSATPSELPVAQAGPAHGDAVSVIRDPADVPPPVGDREPTTVRYELTTVEVNGILADGTTFHYMTFDGTVPGPMLRVRVGDTVEIVLRNADDSHLPHSIDLHAVTGPGGGATYTQTLPGGETSFTFQALSPGLYVYHCATPSVAHHITSGMYGLILVEPEGGLPPVTHEFYVMQGELYTEQPFGTAGHLDFSYQRMLDEQPTYFVFNGAVGALAQDEYALRASVGDTVRIYFGVGGPNFISSFHVIGEIFDRVYDQASLTSLPLTDVQTTLVPPGGATVVEFAVEVPGRYILVDHALSRAERGLMGLLIVDGPDNPAIFDAEGEPDHNGH